MTDLRRSIAAGCLALVLCLSSLRLLFPLHAGAFDDRIPALADAILAEASGGDVQQWLDEALPEQVGLSAPDWYAIILTECGYDLSAYEAALHTYIAENEVGSGSTRERLALACAACAANAGNAPPAVCAELLDGSAGTMGIMSWIFALHLMNNGVPSSQYARSEIARILTDQQAPDGGWSLTGDRGDADVTAMTLQALAPYSDEAAVAPAIQRGLDFLADTQLSSGAYQSWGTENPESTAQVWTALSALGIDALRDDRFIKNGCTVLDGILQFQVTDGSYSHTRGGEAGSMPTVQVLLALQAAQQQQEGYNILLFYGWPEWDGTAPAVTTAVTEPPAASGAAEGKNANHAEQKAGDAQKKSTETNGNPQKTTAGPAEVTEKPAKSAQTAATAQTHTTAAEITETTAAQTDAVSPAGGTPAAAPKYPYRIPLTAAAGVIFGGAAVFFILRKNRSPKTYLTLAGGFLLVTALIWCIKIESPAQFYQAEEKAGGGTVTMAIRCDAICGMDGSERFPADGIILETTAFSIREGENALELLYDAVKANQLQIEVDGVSGGAVDTAYVRGIASLYEFDFGELSGWTYEVNGERPAVGCGACLLHDGDTVEWIYTVNL